MWLNSNMRPAPCPAGQTSPIHSCFHHSSMWWYGLSDRKRKSCQYWKKASRWADGEDTISKKKILKRTVIVRILCEKKSVFGFFLLTSCFLITIYSQSESPSSSVGFLSRRQGHCSTRISKLTFLLPQDLETRFCGKRKGFLNPEDIHKKGIGGFHFGVLLCLKNRGDSEVFHHFSSRG
jgi:hypothetical protein